MQEEAYDQLVNDVSAWVATVPSKEDIFTYAGSLSPLANIALKEGCIARLEHLHATKNTYFKKCGWQLFLDVLPEDEQFRFIVCFAGYDAASVFTQVTTEHPSLAELSRPAPSITAWAKEYNGIWESCLYLVTAPRYLKVRMYAKSLLDYCQSDEEVKDLENRLRSVFMEDGRLFEEGELKGAHFENGKALLTQLVFLPKEYIDSLLERSGQDEKYRLLLDLIVVLQAVQGYGLEKARQDTADFQQTVWDALALGMHESVIAKKEAERINASGKAPDYTQVLQYLSKVWSEGNVSQEQTGPLMHTYIETLGPEQKKAFVPVLESFLQGSTLVEALLLPLDSEYVIARIRATTSLSQAEDLFQELLGSIYDPEKKKLMNHLLIAIYTSFSELDRKIAII